MCDSTQCLVLSEDEDAAEIGIDAVGERNVDDAVESAEGTAVWHGRE